MSRRALATALLACGGAGLVLSGAGQYSLKDILLKEHVTRLDRSFPIALNVRAVELAPSNEGLRPTLDDRWHSNEAFRGNFRDEFRDGLAQYLELRGFSVAATPDAIDVKVNLTHFEGFKRVHDDGGDLWGTLTLSRGGSILGQKPLVESLSYRDQKDERRAFAGKYGLNDVSFDTVIFYRLSVSFYASIVEGILDFAPRDPQHDSGLLDVLSGY
jgi:hypothetical protein